LPADASAATAATPLKNGVNGTSNGLHASTPDTAPPAYSNRSPSPEETFTPNQRSSAAAAGPTKLEDEPSSSKQLGDAKASASNLATKFAKGSVATTVSNAVPTSYEELKAQLAQAQATIASYGQEGGLRLRKAAGVSGDSVSGAANDVATRLQGSEGVPVQIVAALCLFSFLLAYLFF